MELTPYRDTWDLQDRHANFKAEVVLYSTVAPLPTLERLSQATGIPVSCLICYVLVKYTASGADALLAMTPWVVRQRQDHIARAEAAGTESARLAAYQALRHMVTWLALGEGT